MTVQTGQTVHEEITYRVSLPDSRPRSFRRVPWVLFHEVRRSHWQGFAEAVQRIPLSMVFLAGLLTVVDYFILTGYDTLAFRYVKIPLRYRDVAPASFTSYVFAHNLGFSILSGGTVRYRLYTLKGVSSGDVAGWKNRLQLSFHTFWQRRPFSRERYSSSPRSHPPLSIV